MNEKLKHLIRNFLLAFVLLSVGFSLGKEFTKRSLSGKISSATDFQPDRYSEGKEKVQTTTSRGILQDTKI